MDTPDPVVLPESPPPKTPRNNLEEIRNGVMALATSDKMDKESALQVTRLFHSMEILLRHECNQRDATIASVQSEMERTRLQMELDRLANRRYSEDIQVPTPRSKSRFSR